MDRNAVWKWLLLFVLASGSLFFVMPPKEKIRLGLDLKGGSSFVVQIDEDKIREEITLRSAGLKSEEVDKEVAKIMSDAPERALEVLKNRIDPHGIMEPIVYLSGESRIVIQIPGVDPEHREEAKRNILSVAFLEFRMVHEKNFDLTERLFDKGLVPEGFRITRIGNANYYQGAQGRALDDLDMASLDKLGRFEIPDAGYEFMLEKEEVQGATVFRPYFVKRRPELTGEFLEDAAAVVTPTGPVVTLEFGSRGKRLFADVTRDYAPGGTRNPDRRNFRQLAIVLDGVLHSAPQINEAIYSGNAEISGRFTQAEAHQLASILRAGSLPAPVKIMDSRYVAPSLGADSIRSGIRAILYGALGVVIFMFIYYRVAGVIANLALILDLILLPLGMIMAAGFLGIFVHDAAVGKATQLPVLTLPGIAGIVLTMGMAVDANVLIFERIREELQSGKRIWSAVIAGYDRAFITIVDANLTTLLTGVILFSFGSGPIRGFAVTLCAGIIVSMFTALVVTKLLFGVYAAKAKSQTLTMMRIVKDTAIDFVGKWRPAVALSVFVILGSWGWMVYRGVQNPSAVFGLDFTGGTAVTLAFDQSQKPSTGDIRDSLSSAGMTDVQVQYQQEIEGDTEHLQIRTGPSREEEAKTSDRIHDALSESFPAADFKVEQDEEVSSQIGGELKKSAVISIVLALLGIIIYLSWRFEFGFALGAIVALLHDVLITVGIFSLFERQISLPIVAALLTIVGYSVNDTIVVFDRIREDIKLIRNKTLGEVCNISINQTLSRTLLTSLTTLITIVMLLILGGGSIFDFALTLCIGVLVGTYSSVFVATPVMLLWHHGRKAEVADKIG